MTLYGAALSIRRRIHDLYEISHLAPHESREISWNQAWTKKIGEPNHSAALSPRKCASASTCRTLLRTWPFFLLLLPSLPLLAAAGSYPRVLRQIVSLASLPTQIINRRDLCRFLESGPERKGEKTQPSSFASSRHIRHPRFFCGTPLGYRGWPINRAHGYKMNIGEHARHVQQWNACLRI